MLSCHISDGTGWHLPVASAGRLVYFFCTAWVFLGCLGRAWGYRLRQFIGVLHWDKQPFAVKPTATSNWKLLISPVFLTVLTDCTVALTAKGVQSPFFSLPCKNVLKQAFPWRTCIAYKQGWEAVPLPTPWHRHNTCMISVCWTLCSTLSHGHNSKAK